MREQRAAMWSLFMHAAMRGTSDPAPAALRADRALAEFDAWFSCRDCQGTGETATTKEDCPTCRGYGARR